MYNGFEGKKVLFVFDAPAGTKGFYPNAAQSTGSITGFNAENEFVIDSKSWIRIDGVTKKKWDDGGWGSSNSYYEVHGTIVTDHFNAINFLDLYNKHVWEQANGQYKPPAASDVSSETQEAITKIVDDLYVFTNIKDPVPTLTDAVIKETALMKALKQEIADLETSVKNSMDPEEFKNLETLKTVNEGVKKSDDWSTALYQAWTCYKGGV
jgi:hypothetical protein